MTTLAEAPKRADTIVELAIGAGVPAEAVGRLAEAIARSSGTQQNPEVRSLALDAEAERHADRAGIVPNAWRGSGEKYTEALRRIESDAFDAEAAAFGSAVETFKDLQRRYEPLLADLRKLENEKATKHADGQFHLTQIGHFRQSTQAFYGRVTSIGDGGATASVFDLYCQSRKIAQRERLRIHNAIEAYEAFVDGYDRVSRELTSVSRQMSDLEQRYPQLSRLRDGAG